MAHSRPLPLVALILLALAGAAQPQAESPPPLLFGSFETEADAAAFTGPVTRVQEQATHGDWSLKFECPGSQKDTWPGVSYTIPDGDWSQYQLLLFDVYNPEPEPVGLSLRVDDLDGKTHFESHGLQAAEVTTCEVWIRGLSNDLDITRLKRIFPYIRMPRRAYTLYFDNFRLDTLAGRFRRAEYIDEADLPPLSAEDAERGYVLFRRHWLDLVFPNSIPRAHELQPKLEVLATPGEYEPLTFSLRALRDLSPIALRCSDLRTKDGPAIPADAIHIGRVRAINKRLTYSDDTYFLVPKFIEPYEPEALSADTTARFWLTLHVPADAADGLYRGAVTVTPADGASTELPLTVRVLPFRLPPIEDKLYGVYYRTNFTEREDIERDLRDMRRHGMTSVGLCFGPDLSRTTIGNGQVSLGWDGTSKFEIFMDLYKQLGFEAPLLILSDAAQHYAASEHSRDTPEFADTYKLVQIAINRELQRRGWAELIVQPVDEPAWQGREAMDSNLRCLRILKEVPGQRTEQDGPGDDYFHHEAGPFADLWNYNGAYAAPEVVEQAKLAGHTILVYNNDVEGYRPELDRYAAGFHLALAGTDGVFNWEYRGGYGDLYDDLDGKTGDWVMCHLPDETYRGGPATGWEGFREGIDDQRYLALLRSLLLRARASGNRHAIRRASRAEAALRQVLGGLQYSPRLRGTARFARTATAADGVAQFSGRLKVPNGWGHARYDHARWQIAQSAVAILRAFDDLPEQRPPLLPTLPTGKLTVTHVESRPATSDRPAHGRPILIAGSIPEPPAIDGRLDDPAWQRTPDVPQMQLATGAGPPQANTAAWIAFDKRNLYIAARCDEPQISGLVANVTEDGGDVWTDDCVEVFIDPDRDRRSYFQVIVNSVGAKTAQWHGLQARVPDVQAAASVGDNEWSVEIAIPRRDLPSAGEELGLNLCRERRAHGGLELSCWSPTGGSFARPDRFGDLLLGGKYIARLELPRLLIGPNPATVVIRNDGRKTASLALEVKTKTGSIRTDATRLEPGAEHPVGIDINLSLAGAPELVDLRVLGDLGLPVSRRQLRLAPAPPVRVTLVPAITYDTDDAVLLTAEIDVSDVVRRRCEAEIGWKRGNQFQVLERVPRPPAGALSAVLRAENLSPGEYTIAARLIERRKGGLQLFGEAELHRIIGPFTDDAL